MLFIPLSDLREPESCQFCESETVTAITFQKQTAKGPGEWDYLPLCGDCGSNLIHALKELTEVTGNESKMTTESAKSTEPT